MLCLCCACWSAPVRPSGVHASCLGFMYLRLLWRDALQSILYQFSLNASILLPVRPCWENETVLNRQHPVGTGGWRCLCLCSAYGQPPCARGLQAEAGTSLHAFCGLWILSERTLPRSGSAPCKGFWAALWLISFFDTAAEIHTCWTVEIRYGERDCILLVHGRTRLWLEYSRGLFMIFAVVESRNVGLEETALCKQRVSTVMKCLTIKKLITRINVLHYNNSS